MKGKEKSPGNDAGVPVGGKGRTERETRQRDFSPFLLAVSSGEAAVWPGQRDTGQMPGSRTPGSGDIPEPLPL